MNYSKTQKLVSMASNSTVTTVDPERAEIIEVVLDTPVFPEQVYANLPDLLKLGANQFKVNRERDMFLLASITLISGCMPNVVGKYDRKQIWPPLYTMISAPPASGKGVIIFARKYIEKIEQECRSRYKDEVNAIKKEKQDSNVSTLKKAIYKKIVLSANSSSSAFIRDLNNSNGSGIIFETEADTLSITLSKDWGNYSDLLRKAFHHEPISSSRMDDASEIEILTPKLATLISGTFDQVTSMKLDNPMNGLQSRFMFYLFDTIPRFKDVSPYADNANDFDFSILGDKYSVIYDYLKLSETEFYMGRDQWTLFTDWFSLKLRTIVSNNNNYASAMVTRLAVSAYRILMVLATLRSFENGLPSGKVYCSNKDIVVCHYLMETLIAHSNSVFQLSLHNKKDEFLAKQMKFLELLPSDKEFQRKEAIEFGKSLFSERTIDRLLAKLVKANLLELLGYGRYFKRSK